MRTISTLGRTNDGVINGAVKVSLGTGQNQLKMSAGTDATLMIGQSLNFLSASAAGQINIVELRNVKVQGATVITTGGGNDFITIDDAAFNGKFTLNTAGGADTVNIEQNFGWAGQTHFNQAVVIRTGAGTDAVKVSGVLAESERKAIFNTTVLVDGGLDADTLLMTSMANIFYGLPPVIVGI